MRKLRIILPLLIYSYCYGQNAYSTPHNYNNQPLYSPDIGLMERALNSRQSKYNERFVIIQTKVDNIWKLLVKIKNRSEITPEQADFILDFAHRMDKYYTYDFSVDINYQSVYNWLVRVENNIFSWL